MRWAVVMKNVIKLWNYSHLQLNVPKTTVMLIDIHKKNHPATAQTFIYGRVMEKVKPLTDKSDTLASA